MTLSEKINCSDALCEVNSTIFLLQYDLVEAVDMHTNERVGWKFSSPVYARRAFNEQFARTITESAPPSKKIEKWIQRVKPIFQKRYGDDHGSYLYGRAWKMYNKSFQESTGFRYFQDMTEEVHANNAGGGQIGGVGGEPPGPRRTSIIRRNAAKRILDD
jgi:hypothetical protein